MERFLAITKKSAESAIPISFVINPLHIQLPISESDASKEPAKSVRKMAVKRLSLEMKID
jgi:hypothetical protein